MTHPNYGFPKHIEEIDLEDIISNDLPRAVIRPNSYVLLDGEWNFEVDVEDRGLNEEWFKLHEYHDKATWPGSVEDHMSQARGDQGPFVWNDKIVVWYEREFPLPERIEQGGVPRTLLQLTFGACGYETRVWVNGFPLHTIEGE